jgi:hypothetical protein
MFFREMSEDASGNEKKFLPRNIDFETSGHKLDIIKKKITLFRANLVINN